MLATVRPPRSVSVLLLALGACATPHPNRLVPPPPPQAGRFLGTVGRDIGAAPARLWADTRAVGSNGGTWIRLMLGTAYAVAHENLWEEQEAATFQNHTIYGRNAQDGLAIVGNGFFLFGGALAWYLGAVGGDHDRSREASTTVLSALTVTSASTLLIKALVPDGRPSGGKHDFPSGHTSLTMATAATLDEIYGHRVGVPAYGIATLVALQRLDTRRHDTGAVLFGALLGYSIGAVIGGGKEPTVLGLRVAPWVDPESGGLGITLGL
jgi:hypothetical protein